MVIIFIDIKDYIMLLMSLSDFQKNSQSFNTNGLLGFIDFFLEESIKISDSFSTERSTSSISDVVIEFFNEVREEDGLLGDSTEDIVDLLQGIRSIEINSDPFSKIFELDEFGSDEVGFSENFEIVQADVKTIGIKLDFGVLEIIEDAKEELEFELVHDGIKVRRLSSKDFLEVTNESFSFLDEHEISSGTESLVILISVGDFVEFEEGIEDRDIQRSKVEIDGDKISKDIFEFAIIIIQDLGFNISIHVDRENFFKSVLALDVVVEFMGLFNRILKTSFEHEVFKDNILLDSKFLGFEISFLSIMGFIKDEVKFKKSFVFLGVIFELFQGRDTTLDSSFIFCG